MVKISTTKHVTKQGQVKKNPTKDTTKLLKKMLYFEDLSTDYIDSQIKGILVGDSERYLDEKKNNIIRFLDGAIENFISRMKYPEYSEKFSKIKLPTYTKGTTEQLKKMLWFEYLATDYIDSQINGIISATDSKRTWYDDTYLNEKRENIIRFLNNALESFIRRIKNPEIRAEWDAGKR